MSGRVVAVDVGNSTVGLATRVDDRLASHHLSLSVPDWITECQCWAKSQIEPDPVDPDQVESDQVDSAPVRHTKRRWMIASVKAPASKALISHLSESVENEVHQVTRVDVPIKVNVDHPDRVGIDRLLAAHAALQTLTPPFAIVDVGSAITVDWVDDRGHFCGGAIMPGLSLQAAALYQGTDALPELALGAEPNLRLPGRNTDEAIRAGILFGTTGAVEALVKRYAAAHDHGRPTIALTGGQADLIAPLMVQNYRLLPNLVCRGLLELPRSKRYVESESGIH